MKTFFAVALLVFACALSAAAQGGQQPAAVAAAEPCNDSPQEQLKLPAVKRGQPIADEQRVAFADALKEPQAYAGKQVVIEGVVNRVCKKEGCWMEIAPAKDAASIRVTFKNHAFFVPKDADGSKFRAAGEFTVRKLDKATVEHLVKEDGAQIKTNPDGTADEVTFVATGVELWKQ
ncbi:MAG TPA: DUF4920 domain-containing protein [Pyrinomonadaceae bacterium]|jgi:hypothetical protein